MNFVISSTQLLSHLQAVGRVINSKNSLPILDNFLFQIAGKEIVVTASDLETTFTTKIELADVSGEGVIALEAKRLTDILKEFPEQPLTFNIDETTLSVDILSQNGKFSVKGQSGEDFPQLPKINEKKSAAAVINASILSCGIEKTLFATADDELRPVMNGIFFELTTDDMTCVASDGHRLVRYKRSDAKSDVSSSFILPKKPASLLKNVLPKVSGEVKLNFNEKNAFFSFGGYNLICRLVEGNYPSYNSVIPTVNPNKMIIDRVEFYTTLKRVSIFSNQASNLIKLHIKSNEITISAQDIDFSISAYERINCQYEGEEMEIGFKSPFLVEILSNLPTAEVVMEFSDPTRAGILVPHDNDIAEEDILMLLMPMMVGS